LGADPRDLIKQLGVEKDVSVRRALLLSLGEFTPEQLPPAEREPLIPEVLRLYRENPDAGLHGAAEWLLRQWGQAAVLKGIDEGWRSDQQRREERLASISTEPHSPNVSPSFLQQSPGGTLRPVSSCWY